MVYCVKQSFLSTYPKREKERKFISSLKSNLCICYSRLELLYAGPSISLIETVFFNFPLWFGFCYVAWLSMPPVYSRLNFFYATIQAGADVNVRTGDATPLLIAAHNGSAGVINCLLQAGADPNAAEEVIERKSKGI